MLLIATLLSLSKNRHRMLYVGTIYITAVFLTYLAAGFGLLFFIQKMNIAEELSWIVGGLVVILGLLEIKDFFWYGKGISLRIPARRAEQIKKLVKNVSIPGSIVLGIFVAAVELPCTGGPYLAITTLLAKMGFSWSVFWLLAVYNFIFVLPLIVILFLAYFGVSTKKIHQWKKKKNGCACCWSCFTCAWCVIDLVGQWRYWNCAGIEKITILKNYLRFWNEPDRPSFRQSP